MWPLKVSEPIESNDHSREPHKLLFINLTSGLH